ncbi:MAG: glycosyltransferase [Methylomarinum sp.]|nr:glycosyltransferase [Methylomarinum sp.]
MIVLDSQYSTTRRVTLTPPTMSDGGAGKIPSMLFLPEIPERMGQGGLRTNGYFKTNKVDIPLISVITIVYNGDKYIEQTINSVIGQSYNNVEYIIIDGGSTDGTLDVVRKYEKQIDYWVSEPDKGISDAFNKGISLCTGEIIGIINADDWYENDSFEAISDNIKKYDVLYGDMIFWNERGEKNSPVVDHNKLKRNMTLCHPSCFIKRSIYKKYGMYDNEYRYAMDYNLLLNLFLKNCSFYHLANNISNMRTLGMSDEMWRAALGEVKRAKKNNGLTFFNYQFFFLFYLLKQSIRRFFQLRGLGFVVNYYRKITQHNKC